MEKKVNIIGAGIAGLSAGCYLQMNGYDTEIFELHSVPGGLCCAWPRQGYTVEGCIHWLVGSSPSDPFYRLWNELIDMKKLTFVDHDEYIRVEDEEGNCMRVFTDLDRLEQEMLAKAPEDKKLIRAFTKAVRKFIKFHLPVDKAPETYGPLDGLKLMVKFLPFMGAMRRWTRISAQDYIDRCRNPLLKKTFEMMFVPEMSMSFLIFTMGWMHKRSAGYPIGGSLEFARLIEKRYRELGGKIHYNSRVTKVLTTDGAAHGIRLENGDMHPADIVISAADGHFTIFEMLEGRYIDERIKDYYDHYETFPSYVQVSLGVGRTFPEAPQLLYFPLGEPLVIDESASQDYMGVRVFNFDPSLAPPGKTAITCLFGTENYLYWQSLREQELKQYKKEKQRIAQAVIDALEKKFGDVRKNVEMIDVATPATVIRYTNNWKGSFEGWLLTPKMGLRQMKKTLPGLRNFYMIGQWVEPGGGLPPALLSGRNVTQIICQHHHQKFTTTHY
jgi:phytoene dehydrogenase-like protein